MDRDELTRRLMGVFLGEMEEHLAAWNRELLALERVRDELEREGMIRALFRTAHSLKGASRSVGLAGLERFCHRLEGRLAAVRSGEERFDAELVERLLRAGDLLEEARGRLGRGEPIDELGDVELEDLSIDAVPAPQESWEAASLEPLAAGPGAAPQREGQGIRVVAEKLDHLLARSGELRTTRTRLEGHLEELSAIRQRVARWRRGGAPANGSAVQEIETLLGRFELLLRGDVRAVGIAAEEVDEGVRATRMMPFSHACRGLERVVRDAARGADKRAELVVEGGGVQLDRAVLEGLRDPLVQLVRNAVGHGIEQPAGRREAGKPEQGRIVVRASLLGSQVAVAVLDDGRGLDYRAIRARAMELGLPEPRDDDELARVIFEPGFSTAQVVDELSGRGVGLDVVKERAERIHGGIEVESRPGEGTTVTISVPLTLSTVQSLLLRLGSDVFALPTTHVRTLRRVSPSALRTVDGRAVLQLEGEAIHYVPMAEALGLPPEPDDGRARPTVIAQAAWGQAALAVDELLGVEDVVVSALGPRVRSARHVAGATLLPEGSVALILSGGDLVRSALGIRRRAPKPPPTPLGPRRRRILVVDDSATTRALERTILEAAGYEVLLASDGAAAFDLLREREVDLVVSDVEMPRLDGLALTRRIRESSKHRDLPVVLLTALSREEERLSGLEAGADAYLTKDAFDHTELLLTIEQLL